MITKTKITPFEDRVLIKPDKAPELSDAGLYIPEQAREKMKPSRGTVLAVGPGKLLDDKDILVKIYNILANWFSLNWFLKNSGNRNKYEELKNQPIPLKPGDRVLYGNHAGTPVEDPDTKETLLIMRFADCFCLLQEGEELG